MRRIASTLFLVAGLVGTSCGTPHPAASPGSAVGIAKAPDEPVAEPTPPAREAAGPLERFSCGKQSCRVGEESCCGRGEHAFCRANAPPDPPTSGQLLGNQIAACRQLPSDQDTDEIARCRSSSHCPSGQLCCEEFMYGGASALICKPALPAEISCEYGEVCTPDLPCRSPGSVCVQGHCRKKAEVACGKVSCDLRSHTCVVADPAQGNPQCKTNAEVAAARTVGPVMDVGCVSHADCLPGELCHVSLGRTYCQRADDGMSGIICDTAADCPKDRCRHLDPQHPTSDCVRDPDFWHEVCECR